MEMSETVDPVPPPPVLQKPPGYRDPNAPAPAPLKPLKHKPILPSSVYDYHRKKKRGKRGTCCCCLCLSLLIILVILAALSAFFYLWFNPKLPVFHLQSFRIRNLTLTGDGSNHIDSRALTVVEVKNPNSKIAIYYGHSDIDMRLDADGKELRFTTKRVEGFRQSKGNVTRLKVENTVKGAAVGGTLGEKLKKKEAKVGVTVKTSVGVEFWGLKVGKLGVKVECSGVKLKEVENGDVMPRCSINALKWINIH